jgi:hypothetical protein
MKKDTNLHAIVIGFRPLGAISGKSIYGKVGPFTDEEEVYLWCNAFRKKSIEQSVDMTAMPLDYIGDVFNAEEVKELFMIPTMDHEEIIRHAAIPTLFGI